MKMGEPLPVVDPLSVINLLQLPVFHDPDDIAELLIREVKNPLLLVKYDLQGIPPALMT